MIKIDEIKIAYKKLKANVYYDKTQLVLRNAIVEYEKKYENDAKLIEDRFKAIIDVLNSVDNKEWKKYVSKLKKSVRVLYFPKELKKNVDNAIINDSPKQIKVSSIQNFIDIDVEGQILGVLWVMTVGRVLDKEIYIHSYGNRIKERMPKLNNQATSESSFSPYLFEPYFAQYESWRDKALDAASEILDKKQDTIILTMDFTRFYYSLHISKEDSDGYYTLYSNEHGENKSVKRINNFVYQILKEYSRLCEKNSKKNFLPIGFFPSNILSNYSLKRFDDSIIKRWNPMYYGRYVDDIIIVDKVEKNSALYEEAQSGILSNSFVLDYFLCNCNADKSVPCLVNQKNPQGLLVKEENENPEVNYKINSSLLSNKVTEISVQNKKVKVFYFKASGSRSLLEGFRKALYKNTSEFRYLPEDDAVLVHNDYSEVYDLKNSDTINKLRGVESIAIDKYAMSKFLGKILRIGELINDPSETQFEKDILKIFDAWNIIDNYTTWEKVIQILALNGRFSMMHKYVMKISESIIKIESENSEHIIDLQNSLFMHLYSSLCRGLSLIWGDSVKKIISDISEDIQERLEDIEMTNTLTFQDIINRFNYKNIRNIRQWYCYSRMCDKYSLISSIDFIICNKTRRGFKYRVLSDKANLNLTNFDDFIKEAKQFKFDSNYCYYPYIITPQDLSFSNFLLEIQTKTSNKLNPCDMNKNIQENYAKINFNEEANLSFDETEVCEMKYESNELKTYGVKIGDKKKGFLNIAIANVKLRHSDFVKVLEGRPNRTYDRYKEVSHMFNEALRENSDMLIFPESYLPIEWLPIVARTCAKNQIALISGIEQFIVDGNVFNFTVTILPYMKDDFQFAHISYHLKVHCSPEEERQIIGHRLKPITGQNYELFNWNDIWFSVYCCFELASISDRSIFKNYPDMFVAVEWNKDTIYFGNIIESLCRDMHCYCVQVNSSDYGDSRILQPSETVTRDIVKTKGGINNTILIGQIDVNRLRSFQRKEYELQKDIKIFKPTPPQFDKDIIVKKINGELWEDLSS